MRSLFCLSILIAAANASACEAYFDAPKEKVVKATLQAIAEEACVLPSQVVRTEEKGGAVVCLEAPYAEYSKVRAKIKEDGGRVEVEVKATTGGFFHSTHSSWSERIYYIVGLKLAARKYGTETAPTSLPAALPASNTPQTAPPSPQPATPPPPKSGALVVPETK